MLFKKDELSKYSFISVKEFLLVLVLMFFTTLFSFLVIPIFLEKTIPQYSKFFTSHYFGILIFFLSAILSFYVIYYFSCKSKRKTLKEGLFLYPKSIKTNLLCLLIGIVVPLATLPIIFKFAPKEFYAMDMTKTKEGMMYLFTCALFAPIFEEVFYRGFIFPFFQSKFNSFWAVTITSLFFGLSHYVNIGDAYVLLSLFIFYGFVLTLIRYFTNSLVPPIITHFIHNVTLLLGFFVVGRG